MRQRILVVAGVAVAALALWAGQFFSSKSSVGENQSREADVAVTSSEPRLRNGGIANRTSDPAAMERRWLSENVDASALEHLTSVDINDPHADLDEIREVLPWASGLAFDDEAGKKIAQCRYNYERKVAEESTCTWKRRLVVRRTGKSSGVIAGVDLGIPDDASETCRRFAGCVADAEKDRAVPLPSGNEELLSFRSEAGTILGREGLTPSMSDEEYATHYDKLNAELSETINERAKYVENAKHSGEWDGFSEERRQSFERNLLIEELWLENQRVILDEIERQNGDQG